MPRLRGLRKQKRRESARAWIKSGANVTVHSYAKRYGVDRYTAYADLTAIKFPLPSSAERWAERPPSTPRRKRSRTEEQLGWVENDWIIMDGRRFFVVGYTSGGAPYGVFEDEFLEPEFEDELMDYEFEDEFLELDDDLDDYYDLSYREAMADADDQNLVDDQDLWAQWLRQRRDAGDEAVRERTAPMLAEFRDRVLDGAALAEGDVLLDVGTGNGLIAFGAVDRVGPSGLIIFSDVSADLLAECRRQAAEQDLLEQCRFVQASADDLHDIPDASVDVVTTRSVLIYVADKQAAFGEFLRVLRPGGRLSIFEPINSFAGCDDTTMFGIDVTPVADLAAKILQACTTVPSDQDPMLNFDERDLLRWARAAGFTELTLDYRAEVDVPEPLTTTDWEVLKKMAPNPLAPTLDEAIALALTDAERERFEAHARTALATGTPNRRTFASAYLRASAPHSARS